MTTFREPSIEPTEGAIPLVRFKSTLKEINETVEVREGARGKYESIHYTFGHVDLQVIETTEPWPLPICSIRLPYNRRPNSVWIAFGDSIKRLGIEKVSDLLDKEQEWFRGPAKLRLPVSDEDGNPVLDPTRANQQLWEVQDGTSWQVVSCEGYSQVGGVTAIDYLVGVLNGKTQQDFQAAIFSDTVFRKLPGSTEVISTLTEGKLLAALEAGGKITKDSSGIYHAAGLLS